MPCIDIHHHFFPPDLQKTKAQTPPGHLHWTPELSLKAMDDLAVDVSIFVCEEDRKERLRERNLFAHRVCQQYPSRFGFFATLPFFDDVEGCLEEIQFAFDQLHADGISLASSYGLGAVAKYVGDDSYESIWRELDKRNAVVFLHGAQTPSSTPYPHAFLGVPITEVPNETFKAAAHLVVSGRKRRYPNVKIILAHMGGTLASMAARTAILEDFKSFYFDTALSAYGPTLATMEAFAKPGHILFGTDFPAVSTTTVSWFSRQLREHYLPANSDGLRDVFYRNTLALLPNRARYLKNKAPRGRKHDTVTLLAFDNIY
ncbi:amidohydrolase 2 [Ephemerocybe angulata]|uniref:Amidohydrolase 2 n=1 Tax=Ephemerocybe angulata TaxID=980116 RepID=A0A8H6IB60_9AGAR|nr:amidohydrolase 2 [Tulosesus angulatus]